MHIVRSVTRTRLRLLRTGFLINHLPYVDVATVDASHRDDEITLHI